jgi:D-amino peptidase
MTKIYISADIEGVTGVTNWDETELNKPDYAFAQAQMTAEVRAACEGALMAGASEILVKDAHDKARNLIGAQLPQEARLIRGWSGHPYMMMQELDETFDGAVMIGYHSGSGVDGNPLSHTMTGKLAGVWINERPASEFVINSYTAASLKVPVLFLSGDEKLCEEAGALIPGIRTVAVKSGVGSSTTSLHPELAASLILEGVKDAVQGREAVKPLAMPAHFKVEIRYKEHFNAFQSAFYPGAKLTDPNTLLFETEDYFEVLRLVLFVA